ncbi:MAG: RagB/SusD family nutrient uptake outer membrane protein [Tannerella sp.]|jgi:hypothetical protein|nr:RagB/SusD family nutrient uptake outer membrane protein [Tannerella sp.]
MKTSYFKTIFLTAICSLILAGCSDILDEQPRSSYDPTFFTTETGVMGGLNAMYAHLRYFYGQYYYAALECSTDEYTFAWSADNNFKDADLTEGVGNLNPSSCRSDALWNEVFSNINTASGIIENAASVGLSEALIAEARFFRAYDYFQLVQTFGGVPLDLGSGELAFNITPKRTSVRNTVPEVYTKAIFPDLITAVNNLPDNPRIVGGATKTLARLILAKAYLTYAWWLENPDGIDTYPACDRSDPDGHDKAWYFQKAYDYAVEGIQSPGSYGLMDNYYDLHLGSNDRNKEVMLFADHTEDDEYYDGQSHSYFSGGAPGNQFVWFVTFNYTLIRSNAKADWSGGKIETVKREAAQAYGRPWSCMAPPIGVFTNTFADKTNDSRYDGTFTTVFRGNWAKGGDGTDTYYNANGLPIYNGDAVLTFLDEDLNVTVDYSDAKYDSDVRGGVAPDRADYVVEPSFISRGRYPILWKCGTYRTDNGDGLGQPNGGITRPINLAYFSELFLTAAEAAVKGASTKAISGTYANDGTARGLVNVIRARAGKWRWDNNGNTAKVADNSAAMTAATPAVIDIDYILAERSREYYGEGHRWNDLVRTQKWIEYSKTYEIGRSTKDGQKIGTYSTDGDPDKETFTRIIEKRHYLRPIPQGQIDALEGTAEEKAAYQNPGY